MWPQMEDAPATWVFELCFREGVLESGLLPDGEGTQNSSSGELGLVNAICFQNLAAET